jgi:hypothetical protein
MSRFALWMRDAMTDLPRGPHPPVTLHFKKHRDVMDRPLLYQIAQ